MSDTHRDYFSAPRPHDLGDESILERLLALNPERAKAQEAS